MQWGSGQALCNERRAHGKNRCQGARRLVPDCASVEMRFYCRSCGPGSAFTIHLVEPDLVGFFFARCGADSSGALMTNKFSQPPRPATRDFRQFRGP